MKKKLIEFEKKIKDLYEKKVIKSPIHLSGNNENELIKIFNSGILHLDIAARNICLNKNLNNRFFI